MSRDKSSGIPEESRTSWLTESRQQMEQDQNLSKVAARGHRKEECFATLPLLGQDVHRAKLKAEMNKDYNEFLSKQKRDRHVEVEAKGRSDSEFIQQLRTSKPGPTRDPPPDDVPDRKDRYPERRDPIQFDQPYRDLERREQVGPPPLIPRYDPLEELRLRRYFEDQLYSAARQGYPAYPPPPLPDAYRYNPYINYYHNMDKVWGAERGPWGGAPPREKRVTFPHEWPEEEDLYGWARQGRRSEMKIRETDRADQGMERRTRSESPLNRSRSAPPDKKERLSGGFMDGFGSGDRGREEERKRREVYARELKEQIRNKQVEYSVAQDAKRTPRSSRPPTPPTQRNQTEAQSQFESPPSRFQEQPTGPPENYQTPPQPDHSASLEHRDWLQLDSTSPGEKVSGDKQAYRRELEKQIEETRRRKEVQAKEIAKNREEPTGEWNPWGKGGAGAPLKDSSGRVVADLKILNKANQVREKTGSSPKLEALADICVLQTNLSPGQKQANQPQVAGGEGVHSPVPSATKEAGGGLTPQQEYREYLKQQVEEKRARKRAEEERIREEDRKEAERLERDRLKLQEDFQRELAKQREKEEAVRRKNEELKVAAEERRRSNQVPSPHVPSPQEKRVRERRRSSPDNTPVPASAYQPSERPQAPSPPIPTLRKKGTDPSLSPYSDQPVQVTSPPLPSLRRNVTTEVTSSPAFAPSLSPSPSALSPLPRRETLAESPLPLDSDVIASSESKSEWLRQLTDMKQQLKHEKSRVHEELERSRTVYQEMDDSLNLNRRNVPNQSFQPSPVLKMSSSVKPPFKIKKSIVPLRATEDQEHHQVSVPRGGVRREERRTVGFHLQNTQPMSKSKPYHREYEPLLKGRSSITPPSHSRPDSTGSNASISTLDIDALALRNDDRMKRLESILRGNRQMEARDPSPDTVIREFLNRGPTRRNKPPS